MSEILRPAKSIETGRAKYQNEIRIGDHRLMAGEPESHGGDDSGPTPMELLCAALASCSTITMRMYADRKEFPLDHVEVWVTHKRGELDSCPASERTSKGLQDVFTKHVRIKGDLSKDQIKRILDIGSRCPVHRALEHTSCMRTITED